MRLQATARIVGAYGTRLGSIDDAIALVGPNTGISTSLGLLDAPGGSARLSARFARVYATRASDEAGRRRPLVSPRELQTWLDGGPLLMDGASWFGEGHWFVGVGYDQNGVYIRDSSGWDTRYLTWSRLYGEVGFSRLGGRCYLRTEIEDSGVCNSTLPLYRRNWVR
jgi:hypothetical protein